jgi:hypothetical protein
MVVSREIGPNDYPATVALAGGHLKLTEIRRGKYNWLMRGVHLRIICMIKQKLAHPTTYLCKANPSKAR